MRTITGSFKHEETFPLPCWKDDRKVLQYDSNWADELVCRSYGEDQSKYELNQSTLELYYVVSEKMRFKVAEITYESYFTDIKGQDWEKEWLETWHIINKEEGTQNKPVDYEMYNMTIFHYSHPALKSALLDDEGNLRGIDSHEYIKNLMGKIDKGYEPNISFDPEGKDIFIDEDEDEDEDDYYK